MRFGESVVHIADLVVPEGCGHCVGGKPEMYACKHCQMMGSRYANSADQRRCSDLVSRTVIGTSAAATGISPPLAPPAAAAPPAVVARLLAVPIASTAARATVHYAHVQPPCMPTGYSHWCAQDQQSCSGVKQPVRPRSNCGQAAIGSTCLQVDDGRAVSCHVVSCRVVLDLCRH
jgi:hypothetical protein